MQALVLLLMEFSCHVMSKKLCQQGSVNLQVSLLSSSLEKENDRKTNKCEFINSVNIE